MAPKNDVSRTIAALFSDRYSVGSLLLDELLAARAARPSRLSYTSRLRLLSRSSARERRPLTSNRVDALKGYVAMPNAPRLLCRSRTSVTSIWPVCAILLNAMHPDAVRQRLIEAAQFQRWLPVHVDQLAAEIVQRPAAWTATPSMRSPSMSENNADMPPLTYPPHPLTPAVTVG